MEDQHLNNTDKTALVGTRRRGLDDYTKPATADIPAVDTNVDSGELIAAQLPQVLVMHDASDGSEVWSCSRQPSRSDQMSRPG